MSLDMSSDMSNTHVNANAPSLMDMYAMMGLTINSPLSDVRRAYKNMAHVCHPDKGGNVQDMHILKNAYDYIVEQLTNVSLENQKGSFEEREAEFTAFIEAQKHTQIPSLNDIEIETLCIPREFLNKIKDKIAQFNNNNNNDTFYANLAYRQIMYNILTQHIDVNDYVQLEKCTDTYLDTLQHAKEDHSNYYASIPGGYGDLLDTSLEPIDVPLQPAHLFGSKEVVIHTEQQECVSLSSKQKHKINTDFYAYVPIPEKLDDYSLGSMCDYKAAYTDTCAESRQLLEQFETNNANNVYNYDTQVKTRESLDTYLSETQAKVKVTLL